MNLREAAEKALEALEITSSFVDGYYLDRGKRYLPEAEEAINALRTALAEAEEPVAWAYVNSDGECEEIEYGRYDEEDDSCITHLYAHPPHREPLTEEEVRRVYREARTPESEADEVLAFARAVERAHGIGESKPQDSLAKGATWERQK